MTEDLLVLMGVPANEPLPPDDRNLPWEDRVTEAIFSLSRRPEWFTADDVRGIAGEPPAGVDPRAIGGHLRAQQRLGRIEPVPGGYTNTRRRTGHAHPQRAWRGVAK